MSTTTTERPSTITVAGTPGDPDNRPRAGADGFYRDPVAGTRHKIIAGDPIPPGVELEAGTDVADQGADPRVADLERELAASQARVAELEANGENKGTGAPGENKAQPAPPKGNPKPKPAGKDS